MGCLLYMYIFSTDPGAKQAYKLTRMCSSERLWPKAFSKFPTTFFSCPCRYILAGVSFITFHQLLHRPQSQACTARHESLKQILEI